jgi:hypothetical protein
MEPMHQASSANDMPVAYLERDPINIDYRIFALVLVCATRADLLEQYIGDAKKDNADSTKWAHLRRLGLPQRLLTESLYVFKDPATQHALRQLQIATRTLVNLDDYCFDTCPSDPGLDQIVRYSKQITQPLRAAGKEE